MLPARILRCDSLPAQRATATGRKPVVYQPNGKLPCVLPQTLAFWLRVFGGRFGSVFFAPVVLALEFLDTACRIDEFLFAGKEGVRRRTDVNCDQWHCPTFEFARLWRFDRRADQELDPCRSVLEYDISVIGMNSLFHNPTALQCACRRKPVE